jgi:carbon monoxide dehydrogenase subunit G
MEMTGERRIPASRQAVWDALNDPEALRAAIPGCESVERTAEDAFQARVAVKLGPMAAKFGGKVKLENINAPVSYTISGEGNGGAMGFAKGGADVALEEIGPAETVLKYHVKAQVGGKMAQLGARLIDSTAKSMADQFFDRFAANLTPAPAIDPTATATGLPAPENAATETAAAAAAASPGQQARTDERVAAARAGLPASGMDTEHLRATGPGPMTQHGAEGISAAGQPVSRPNPRVVDPMALSPLRLLFQIEPMGLPIQFWGGCVIMLVIAALMFL